MVGWEEVTLETIKDGVAKTLFKRGLEEVVENLVSEETELKTPRKITLEFVFLPNSEERGDVTYGVSMKTKLAPIISVGGIASVGNKNGEITLMEDSGKQQKMFG